MFGLDRGASSFYLLESAVLKLEGITDLSIAPGGENDDVVKCVYDATCNGPRDIKNEIEKLGYKAYINTMKKKEDMLGQTNEIKQYVVYFWGTIHSLF